VRRLNLHRLLGVVLATVLASLLLVIIWGIGRGLDITDESFGLLSYLYPQEYPVSVTMFYAIVSRATDWMHPTVIGYRWLTLALRLIVPLVFTWGFCRWLRRCFTTESSPRVSPIVVFLFLLIGYLSVYGISQPTLFYNTINSAFLFVAAGLLLYVLSQAPPTGIQFRAVGAALLAVGFLSAADFFVKFPTALIGFVGALLLVVLHMRRSGLGAVSLAIASLALGAIAGLAICSASVPSISVWLSNYRAELRAISEVSHNPGSLLRSYMHDGASLGRVLILHFSFVFLAAFVIARCYARGWHRKARRNGYLLLVLLALTITYTGYEVYVLDLLNSPYFNGWKTFYSYVLIVCFQVIVLFASYPAPPADLKPSASAMRSESARLGIALLATLPFVAAVGTANHIFFNALHDIAAWFALILVLALLIGQRIHSRWVLSLCLLLPACLGATQLVYGMVWKPYLLAATLREQTVPLAGPPSVAGLKVDPLTANFIAELRSILRKGSFNDNDYVLAFYNAPGLVLLTGGVSPGKPQYFKGAHATNCRALERAHLDKRRVFILATQNIDPQTVACLKKAGLRFPEEFVPLGRVYNPYSASSYGWRAHERWVRVFRQNGRR
jgi:hypothetical protein